MISIETNNPKITVIIPTFNRFDCMKTLIQNTILPYTGNLFQFEVHDSSSDDRLEKFINHFSNKIRYYRYDSSINGDIKSLYAIEHATTPFIYLLGDGLLVDFNLLERKLTEICFEQFEIVALQLNERKEYFHTRKQHYIIAGDVYFTENKRDYFTDCFWLLTLYGASIIRKELCNNENAIKFREIESPFMYICTVFTSLEQNAGKCAVLFSDYFEPNPYKRNSGWIVQQKAIEFFCYRYYNSVILLPAYYDPCCRKFLISHNKYSKLFSLKTCVKFKADGNLNSATIKKYRFYIRKTLPLKNRAFVFLSRLIPQKVAQFVYSIHQKRKRK